jgi:hypothetical protein
MEEAANEAAFLCSIDNLRAIYQVMRLCMLFLVREWFLRFAAQEGVWHILLEDFKRARRGLTPSRRKPSDPLLVF